MDAQLPPPSADAQAASRALAALIAGQIEAAGGWIPFARYMELALYAPGLGYYSGGSRKFGQEGDFLTAPEITPLFGQALARQVAQATAASAPYVLEAGAGSGRLAADLLKALAGAGQLPEKYFILELSGELRARQQATLAAEAPAEAHRVEWLDRLPASFSGCVLANELLDALPAEAVAWRAEGPMERGVVLGPEGFAWSERPAPPALAAAMAQLPPSPPFAAEIGLAARAWTAEWGRRLAKGVLLLIDYGLTRRELYHPQRDGGTLRCHYRHRVHQDPFWWPGLSDITAHVDFTAVAEAGHDAGLDVLGYTSQSGFLMNCGLAEVLAERQAGGGEQATRAMGAVGLLISPNEMGELFKVIALGRGVDEPLLGFVRGDRTHTL
ncbi:MAG TPA: SAM-dependent methyltransferase [Rhodocyclaceae bacterium]|nr:SAM-dependent methyltransferase [Rhodocyclaceae bacterium]